MVYGGWRWEGQKILESYLPYYSFRYKANVA